MQIVAIGGGGFSMEPGNPLLDTYVLGLARFERPKVCFIPTASYDSRDYVERFYQAFRGRDCEPSHLSVKTPNVPDVQAFLLAQDVLYIGGGDTLNLLDQWHKTKFDLLLKQALEAGIVVAGVSAGAVAWFEQAMTASTPGRFAPVKGLGLLEGSCCAHYDSESACRVSYHRFMRRGLIRPGLALDDGVALHYRNRTLARIVSSRPHAQAYRVEVRKNTLVETPLAPDYLGDA